MLTQHLLFRLLPTRRRSTLPLPRLFQFIERRILNKLRISNSRIILFLFLFDQRFIVFFHRTLISFFYYNDPFRKSVSTSSSFFFFFSLISADRFFATFLGILKVLSIRPRKLGTSRDIYKCGTSLVRNLCGDKNRKGKKKKKKRMWMWLNKISLNSSMYCFILKKESSIFFFFS